MPSLFYRPLVLALRTIVLLVPLLLGTWPLTPRGAEAHPLGLTRIIVSFAPDRTYTIDIIVDPESLLAKLEILSGRAPSGLVRVAELPARIGALRETLLAQTQVIFDDQRDTPSFAYLPGPALPIGAQGAQRTQATQGAQVGAVAQAADARAEATAAAGSSAPSAKDDAGTRGAVNDAVPAVPETSPSTRASARMPTSTPTPTSTRAPAPAPATAPSAIVRLSGEMPAGAASFRLNYGLVLGSYAMTVRHGRPMSAESAVAAAVRAGADTSIVGIAVRSAGTTASAASTASTASDTDAVTLWVAGGQDSERIDLARGSLAVSRLAVAWQYFVLGFEHILPKGLDHILFVLGIFLLGTAWRPILLQVTTFTVAHSITLALSMYGVVALPASIVEPLIALSIAYVAIENLWTTELKPWRLVLVFAFGLLHGMGFAGVLRELGLPRSEFVTALLTFNLGVEGGQLAVIGLALALVGWWRLRDAARYRQWVVVPASLAIAVVGAYWTIARSIG